MAIIVAISIAQARKRVIGPASRSENSIPSGVLMMSVFVLLDNMIFKSA
jgi:hypothetical protein